ncbi:MAG: 16S rRNA (guanine(527)-N(7))-methyltransferase RsmG [Desulfobacteraceae bacterium]|nr:16S rRNA (guanine(527)-N(7))-methyltransferase RsmG [Desulfobacteraceae bacterium]
MNTSNNTFFTDKWKNLIKTGGKNFKLDFNDLQLNLFATHAANLHKWNKTINLTSITDHDEIALKHFIDSIAIVPHINEPSRILDIGSGGGFPGFCLKVANPDHEIVMIDAAKKKINFLKDLIRTTGMKNIEAKHVRAEDLANDKIYRESFDIVTSRAFSSLDKFVKLSMPFLNENGVMLAMKGQDVSEEINEMKKLTEVKESNMNIKSFSYVLPSQNIKRSIIQICKDK